MREFGQLAVVQDPSKGGLLSGGILDMIAVKHTPVRPIPGQQLTPDALKGATMAVNVDPEALTPEQKEILRGFTRGGEHAAHRPSRMEGPAARRQDHARQSGARAPQRHLARREHHDRPPQPRRAAVQRLVDAVERAGGGRRQDGGRCTW